MDGGMSSVPDWPGSYVRTDGAELYVRHHQPPSRALPPAVMVHGLGGSASNWQALTHELRDDLDVYAPDLPGWGQSPPGAQHSVQAAALTIGAYLRQQPKPVHLVGNSMGGLVCVLAAAAVPQQVRSLTLISPAMPRLRAVPPDARLLTLLALPRLGERFLARSANVPPEQQVRNLVGGLFGEPDRAEQQWLEAAARERAERATQPYADAVFLASLRSIVREFARPRRFSAWRFARTLTMPVLVVYGGRDRLVSNSATLWHQAVPRARVVTLTTAGHVSMMERPELVAAEIRELLAAAR